MRKFVKCLFVLTCATTVFTGESAQAQQYTPRQQASINVAATYARDTMKMTTFKVESVRQDGTLVNATCSRTVTVRGRTTTTRYAVSFSIAARLPAPGQTTGQLYVSRVTSNQIQ